MAFARDVYIATGGQTDFITTFTYQAEADVVVSQNGTVLTQGAAADYVFLNATTVRFNSGATAADVVVLQRATSQNTRAVDFSAGTLTEEDLDNSAIQAFYMAQESIDIANTKLGLASDEIWDAESTRIKNVDTPTADNDAATKAYVDLVAAGALTSPIGISLGGTGATTADGALTSLGGGSKGVAIFKDTTSAAVMTELGITANGQSLITAADYAAMRALLDLEAGTDFNAYDALLANLSTLGNNLVSGDILYASAADTLARLAKGTDGQVLTLASGLPAWDDAGSGGMVLLDAGAFASTGDLAVTGLDDTTYHAYLVILSGVVPSADSVPQLRVSDNGGSSYDSGATDYDFGAMGVTTGGTAAPYGSTSTSGINLTGSGGQEADQSGQGWSGYILINNPGDGSKNTSVQWVGGYVLAGESPPRSVTGHGRRRASQADDAFQIIPSTGDFASGEYAVYGLRRV